MGSARIRSLAAVIIAAVVVGACARGDEAPAAPDDARRGGTFTFAMGADATVLDPWNVMDDNSLQVTQQIFEPLLTYDAETFEVRPNLAVSWRVSGEGKQWTLKLRDGVRFHDGTPFDSDAVVFNFERARDTRSRYRNTTPVGDDYEYFRTMWTGFDDRSLITKVEAFDRLTVRFVTRAPYGPFLATLAMATFGMVSPATIKADPEGWMRPTSSGAAGTGPFMYRKGAWQKGDSLTLVANPDYWRTDERGRRLPYLDRVVFRTIAASSERIAALKDGDVDALRDISPDEITTIRSHPRLRLLERRTFNVGYVRFNTKAPPLHDPLVRKALAMAIDKSGQAERIYGGLATPATQFLVPGMLGYDDTTKAFQPYDPETARALLRSSGWPSFEVDLWYMPIPRPYYPDPLRTAQAIAADLAAIGVSTHLKTIDFATYRDRAKRNDFQVWLLGWTGDNGDPDNFLCVFFCELDENGQWDSPDAVAAVDLIRDAASETDPLKRTGLYKQVSKIVQREVPAVPMFNVEVPVATSRAVSGYVPHPKGSEAFTLVRVAE